MRQRNRLPAVPHQRLDFASPDRSYIGHPGRKSGIDVEHFDSELWLGSKTVYHQFHHLALPMVRRRHVCKDEEFH